ncbi:hypothetical protein EG329_002324 [Mollisiaceae sp. DMI_Dod_QoI]|nr:hypothetical protein EG329_002324 [Helotiales sp. DMI_Dod_QoI]
MHLAQLVGVWKLVFVNVSEGSVGYDYGPNPLGRIFFSPDGYMNAMITDPDQAKPLPNGTDWTTASDKQLATIARPMVAYSGPYQVVQKGGETYTHVDVEVSLNPNLIGTEQVRYSSFEEKNGKSLLSLIPVVNGTKSDNVLIWEKEAAPA